MRDFTVVLSPHPTRGGYSVSVPSAPGALSQGDTREEALANITEALQLWLEVSTENGVEPLPETPELIAAEVASILGFRDEFGWDRALETATISVAVPAPV